MVAFPIDIKDYHSFCRGEITEKELKPFWDYKTVKDRFVLWIYEIRVLHLNAVENEHKELPHKPHIRFGRLLKDFILLIENRMSSDVRNKCLIAGCICTEAARILCENYGFSFESVSPRLMGALSDDDEHFEQSSVVSLDMRNKKAFKRLRRAARYIQVSPNKASINLFISYKRENIRDAEYWNELLTKMLNDKCKIFFDEYEISGGVEWRNKIIRELWQSDYIILLLDKDTLKSPWVRFELNAAIFRSIPVLVIDLENNIKKVPKFGDPIDILWRSQKFPGQDIKSTVNQINKYFQSIEKRERANCPRAYNGTCLVDDEI